MAARRFRRLSSLALVAAGGFVGAVLRYAVGAVVPGTFPWGTLIANVVGTFLLGIVLYEAGSTALWSERVRLLVGTGFCSSFTTYSTFVAETTRLSSQFAVANVAANYALGFFAVVLGQLFARWLS